MWTTPIFGMRPLYWVASAKKDCARCRSPVSFKRAVYVLHCFQKKSPSGKRAAATDIKLIGRRLKAAREAYEEQYGQETE
jgi:phage-related protein